MRRFKRTRRTSGSKRRKAYWNASVFVGQDVDLDTTSIASAWAKWPSGLYDPKFTGPTGAPQLAANDETWARAVLNQTVEFPLQGVVQAQANVEIVVGLIAWDAASQADAVSLELAVTDFGSPGSAPSPTLRGDFDWIIRTPFCFTRDSIFSFAADATFLNSRAMRKLPPSTGVLWCVSALQPLDTGATVTVGWTLDCRYLLKAGYYGL